MHAHPLPRDPIGWCEAHPVLVDALLILLGILLAALLRTPQGPPPGA